MPRASSSPPQRPRLEVAACYGHVAGVLAERLCQWLLDHGWIVIERRNGLTLNEHLTPEGLAGLAAWGVDVARLEGSRRKPLAICYERSQGLRHEHVGAHLGTLLREWMISQGLIEQGPGGLRLTETGREGLIAAGVLPPTGEIESPV